MLLLYPNVAARSCADCQKYLYEDKPGDFAVEPMRRPARVGLPLLRPPGAPTPCHQCPKIPSGVEPSPLNAIEMTDQNWQAYTHYLECKAIGRFPDDPIVRRNAAIIRRLEDAVAQTALTARLDGLTRVMMRVGG